MTGGGSAKAGGGAEIDVQFDRNRPLEDRVAFLEGQLEALKMRLRSQQEALTVAREEISRELSRGMDQLRVERSQEHGAERMILSQSLRLQSRGLVFLGLGLFLSLIFNLLC